VFRDRSGNLLCSDCDALHRGQAVQQRTWQHRHPLEIHEQASSGNFYADFLGTTRIAVNDLAFNVRTGGAHERKRVHD